MKGKPQVPGYTESTLKKIDVVLEALSRGNSIMKACADANLCRQTFYRWKAEDEENGNRVIKAKESASDLVEDALFNSAINGSNTGQIFWLKNRRPNDWKDRVEQVQDHSFTGNADELLGEIKKKYADIFGK